MSESTTLRFQRDARQRALVPPEHLVNCEGIVIGVGAIGRQVALQLAALGLPKLTLFDDDTVEPENLAPQGYWDGDLDQPKVNATARLCRCVQPDIDVTPIGERFKRSTFRELTTKRDPIVFCCVDNIATRRLIWESIRARARFFVDGRMSAEVIRVLAVADPASDDRYLSTLFAVEQAYVGACTAQSTIYTASIAAGLMLHQFAKWLRGLPVDPDLLLNLLAAELTTSVAA